MWGCCIGLSQPNALLGSPVPNAVKPVNSRRTHPKLCSPRPKLGIRPALPKDPQDGGDGEDTVGGAAPKLDNCLYCRAGETDRYYGNKHRAVLDRRKRPRPPC